MQASKYIYSIWSNWNKETGNGKVLSQKWSSLGMTGWIGRAALAIEDGASQLACSTSGKGFFCTS